MEVTYSILKQLKREIIGNKLFKQIHIIGHYLKTLFKYNKSSKISKMGNPIYIYI